MSWKDAPRAATAQFWSLCMDDRDVAWIQQSDWLHRGGIFDLTASRISVDVAAEPIDLGGVIPDQAALSDDVPDLRFL